VGHLVPRTRRNRQREPDHPAGLLLADLDARHADVADQDEA